MKHLQRISFLFLISLPLFAADADLILQGGKIVTVDQAFSVQEAIAVQNGKILDVGKTSDILKKYRGSHTRVIDLKGRTVLPGLIDSHVHALSSGLSEYRGPMPQIHSFADIQ